MSQDVTSLTGEMYMSFGKFSSSSRQIQKLFLSKKNCVFIDFKNKKRIMLHHFYRKVGKTACAILSCIHGHTEEKKWLPHWLLLH